MKKRMIYKKNSEGATRIIRATTVVFLILFSCCALEAQINRELYIQFELHRYTMSLSHCFLLVVTYCVCFAPMTIYWIIGGYRQDEFM
jgi:hypothetical protein